MPLPMTEQSPSRAIPRTFSRLPSARVLVAAEAGLAAFDFGRFLSLPGAWKRAHPPEGLLRWAAHRCCRQVGFTVLLLAAWIAQAQPNVAGDVPAAAGASLLAPPGAAAWISAPLPAQKLPPTRFDLREVDGRPAWRVESPASYGNLVHAVQAMQVVQGAGAQARTIAWRWRLDRAIERADLLTKAGDDAALKVCALFDMPAERVPFVERQLLRVARAASGQALPAATLCYVWAPLASTGAGGAGGAGGAEVASRASGVVLPNAHTRRMRWMVLRGAESPLGAWQVEQRDLRADFLRAFGDETATVPPLVAVLVGADADNTGGHGLGWLQDLTLRP
jgi:hypothetical protein